MLLILRHDSVTGQDVTAKFDIKVENGVITATSKASMNKSLGDADTELSTQLNLNLVVTINSISQLLSKQMLRQELMLKIRPNPNRSCL